MKKYIISLMTFLLIISCKFNHTYNNRQFRYKVKYPSNWIAVNSNHNKKAETYLKESVLPSCLFQSYKDVDVCFYEPGGKPPILNEISINSTPQVLDTTKINIDDMESILYLQLVNVFDSVKSDLAIIKPYKEGQIIQFKFYVTYTHNNYIVDFYIIPGMLYATYYIKAICKESDHSRLESVYLQVLKSFTKY